MVEHAGRRAERSEIICVFTIYKTLYKCIFGARVWLPAGAWLNGMSRSSSGRCPGIESRRRRSPDIPKCVTVTVTVTVDDLLLFLADYMYSINQHCFDSAA